MSVDYNIYLEMKRKGVWRLCNKKVRYRNDYWYIPSYSNGSRSAFSNTWDELREIGYKCTVNDISKELKKHLISIYNDPELKYSDLLLVNIKDLKDHMKGKKYDRVGYVRKEELVREDWNPDYIDEWLTLDGYRSLPEKEKLMYEYYEWCDWSGWILYFKTILEHVEPDIWEYKTFLYNEIEDARIVCTADY